MQGEKDQGDPTLDVGYGAISLAPTFVSKPPFVSIERYGQLAFEFMDDLELHRVQIPVRRDDPMPEQGNQHSQ